MEDHIRFQNDSLVLLDQRLLPAKHEFITCSTVNEVVLAISDMAVRGAPAIGISGAWGCVLAAQELLLNNNPPNAPVEGCMDELDHKLTAIRNARPTAVNLEWAVERMCACIHAGQTLGSLLEAWKKEAAAIHAEDIRANHTLAENGAKLIRPGSTIMTHCNAGALATGGYGTALGVIRAAHEQGKEIQVIANETRPWLQGARLTIYELQADAIPVTLACDNAAAHLMSEGMVDAVITGADRIAANGDTANKIGTYGLAVLARAHGIPFYIAAPLSTIDRKASDRKSITIEERSPGEVTTFVGMATAPEGTAAYNFSFDVTPADLITAIITEEGILRAPYSESIASLFEQGVR